MRISTPNLFICMRCLDFVTSQKNLRLPLGFIHRQLPCHRNKWFMDAATSWGYCGLCCNWYFKLPHTVRKAFLNKVYLLPLDNLLIAFRELLDTLFASQVCSKLCHACYVRVNSDNKNTMSWLIQVNFRQKTVFYCSPQSSSTMQTLAWE